MNFLSPTAIAVAAGLTIPPLIALYFLKLKRIPRLVPSTLLWKKSVEDLQVNSPFQRLRSSLLLLLQLLVLILGALALGKPMFRAVQTHHGTNIILIDQSASMNVMEPGGKTRLAEAKEQAKLTVDNLAADARAMVIEFCDRANVVSSFDTDKEALKRKIDLIEPTESTTSLSEAMSLAEAYTQNILIGSETGGSDNAPEPPAPPATVFLFTDGRIEQSDRVTLQRFDLDKMHMTTIGQRSDNVGLTAMDARRNYEQPERLEVAATIRNFGSAPATFDATLYVEGAPVDVQSVRVEAARPADAQPGTDLGEPGAGSVRVIVFDRIEFGGGGVIEVNLRVDDALSADNRAWTVIEPPRHLRVLLVNDKAGSLADTLGSLSIDLVRMTGDEYEAADEKAITDGERSAFDVVILDQHSTARLPRGNYFFWGSAPKIEGVSTGEPIDNEVIFNWDETHPILRHVSVETLRIIEWLKLDLPRDAVPLVAGQTSPVLAYLTRDASQFLISAFSPTTEDPIRGTLRNTQWTATADFVVFLQNAVQFLAANLSTTGKKSVAPGEPVTLPLPPKTPTVKVHRPTGDDDQVLSATHQTMHYPRTRNVGVYRLEPGVPGADVFAVNLFNAVESHVEPAPKLTLGGAAVDAKAGSVEVNEPAWPYALLALLVLLLLEWIVYNRRVFV